MSPSAAEGWAYTTGLTVRVADVNYGGHLGNERVLGYFQEIRSRWLTTLGWNEMDLGGVGLIQTEAQVRYRAQAFVGDLLHGRLRVDKVRSRSLTLAYQLDRASDAAIVASGTTEFVFFDYAGQAVARLPQPSLERLTAGLPSPS